MYSVYKIKVQDLDVSFIEALKAMFKDKEIEIVVSEVNESYDDETAYLLQSPANREHLLRSIDNVMQKKNLVVISPEELA